MANRPSAAAADVEAPDIVEHALGVPMKRFERPLWLGHESPTTTHQ
jgi:hypothetical protein